MLQSALNLARNCHYAVFPCTEAKTPTRPKSQGGRGFHDASKRAETITGLWRRWPGPLIGVATGRISQIVALDVDVKHDTARSWFRQHEHQIPRTRVYRTRGGGLHFLFRHCEGVRNSEGKLAQGVDTRGDGGYLIFWFAAGFECLDHEPPAQWPPWLSTMLWPPAVPPVAVRTIRRPASHRAAVTGLVSVVREAAEGGRNAKLNWAAYHMREYDRGLTQSDTQRSLFKSWSDYAIANGERPGTAKWFTQTLTKLDYVAVKNTPGFHGQRGFKGIAVRLRKPADYSEGQKMGRDIGFDHRGADGAHRGTFPR